MTKCLTHLSLVSSQNTFKQRTNVHARPPFLGNGSRVPAPTECVGTRVNLAHTLQASPRSVLHRRPGLDVRVEAIQSLADHAPVG